MVLAASEGSWPWGISLEPAREMVVITVFLSYSAKDHYFAELAAIKLGEAEIELWRDQGVIGGKESNAGFQIVWPYWWL
jgi:hypothetical protein